MALMARSIEMSFSLSRLRRTLRSMSIRAPPVTGALVRCVRLTAVSGRPRFAKLHLHPARSELSIGELTVAAVHVQRDPAVTSRDHTAGDLVGWLGRRCARRGSSVVFAGQR